MSADGKIKVRSKMFFETFLVLLLKKKVLTNLFDLVIR